MFPIHDDTPRLHGRPYVNYILISINVIVFLWEAITTNFFTNHRAVAEIFITYGATPELVLAGNYSSLITSMFLHGGVAHLIGNMVFLYIFGDNIEDKFGHIKYLFLYLSWGIIAALIHSFYAISTGSGDIPAVGASGAISGVLGAYLILFPKAKILTAIIAFFFTTIRIPAIAYIPFWFIMQVIFSVLNPSGGVAYLAHIGGFIAGAAISFIFKSYFSSFMMPNPGDQSFSKTRVRKKNVVFTDINNPTIKPEIIEGANFLEVLAQLRGTYNLSDIEVKLETNNLSIVTSDKKYNIVVPLPSENITSFKLHSVTYLNGIVRVRISKG
ncbi:MAG: rhomboid family intramembrane serine protease [Nitrososphaeraceae archaeon]